MELYFLRHAAAGERDTVDYPDDSLRPLTKEGVKGMKKAADGMRKIGLSFDRIFSSDYFRARQTAEIAAEGTHYDKKIVLKETLRPEGRISHFMKTLESLPFDGSYLFVGHQPSLGEFISGLIVRDREVSLDLKKGSLCRVAMEHSGRAPVGELKWLLTLKQLGRFS